MVDQTLCPRCGARNPTGASWCGQCYERFDTAEEPAGPSAAPPVPPPQPAVPDLDDRAESPGEAADELLAELGAVGGGRVPGVAPTADAGESGEPEGTWTCRVCETTNPLTASACSACQTSIYDSFAGPEESGPDVVPSEALVWSIVPGMGHVKAGQAVLGAAIGGLTLLLLVFGILLALTRLRALGIVFVLAGLLVWGTAAHDAQRWAAGETSSILLRPRIVSIITGVMVFLLIVVAGLAAVGGGNS